MDINNLCKHNGTELFFKNMSHFEMDHEGKKHVMCDFCGKEVVTYLPISEADIEVFAAQRKTACASYAHD